MCKGSLLRACDKMSGGYLWWHVFNVPFASGTLKTRRHGNESQALRVHWSTSRCLGSISLGVGEGDADSDLV